MTIQIRAPAPRDPHTQQNAKTAVQITMFAPGYPHTPLYHVQITVCGIVICVWDELLGGGKMIPHEPLDDFAVRACSGEELQRRVDSSLRTHPQVARVFRHCVQDLIRSKADFDNEALYYLASHDHYALAGLDILETGLGLFDGKQGIGDVRHRLANIRNPIHFHSAYTELDIACYYAGKGYSVALAPSTKRGQRRADLRVRGAFEVTFEALGIWLPQFVKEHRIHDMVKLGLLDQGEFLLAFRFEHEFNETDVAPLLSETESWLHSLVERSADSSQALEYHRDGKLLATMKAIERVGPGESGIGSVSFPGHVSVGASGLRAKLRDKQKQLDSDKRNVIVLETIPLQIGNFNVLNALLGDQQVVFETRPGGSVQFTRGQDRYFSLRTGKKTSAVLFLKRNAARFADCERIVFSNYFASRHIPPGFFADKNVRLIDFTQDGARRLVLKETRFQDYVQGF
jgi:hypothetical protein